MEIGTKAFAKFPTAADVHTQHCHSPTLSQAIAKTRPSNSLYLFVSCYFQVPTPPEQKNKKLLRITILWRWHSSIFFKSLCLQMEQLLASLWLWPSSTPISPPILCSSVGSARTSQSPQRILYLLPFWDSVIYSTRSQKIYSFKSWLHYLLTEKTDSIDISEPQFLHL